MSRVRTTCALYEALPLVDGSGSGDTGWGKNKSSSFRTPTPMFVWPGSTYPQDARRPRQDAAVTHPFMPLAKAPHGAACALGALRVRPDRKPGVLHSFSRLRSDRPEVYGLTTNLRHARSMSDPPRPPFSTPPPPLLSCYFLGRTGQKVYGSRSMHDVDGPEPNPYQVTGLSK